MSVAACAELVARGDPDRFRAAMAAPVAARAVLLPLYAFNLEVARAPWVTAEPLIARMRLQWWRDALEEIAGGGPVRRHEVATPLADVLDPEGARLLDGLVAARWRDAAREGFADNAALEDYFAATGGTLMWVAARALGGRQEARARGLGTLAGLARYLLAVPELKVRGVRPLPDERAEAIAALAGAWDRARAAPWWRERPGRAQRWAELEGWRTGAVLTRARARPERVLEGTLAESEARRRGALLLRALL